MCKKQKQEGGHTCVSTEVRVQSITPLQVKSGDWTDRIEDVIGQIRLGDVIGQMRLGDVIGWMR